MLSRFLLNSTLLLTFSSIIFSGCKPQKPVSAANPTLPTIISVRYPIPALRASMAPFVVAAAKGWYEAEGLNVKFEFGSEALNPVSMVMQDTDQIGVLGGLDTLLVARGNGFPVRAIAILHRNSNFPCLITLKSSGITNVRQLEGKKVGMYYGHISADVLRSLFRSQNVSVNEVDVGYNYSQFTSGKVDAQWAFTSAAAVELPEKGVEVNVISPSDYGIRTHGYTIFAKDEFIQAHPHLIKKFLDATFRGVVFAVENPQETTNMLVKMDKTGNLTDWQTKKRLDEVNQVTSYKDPYPPGYMDDQMIQETYQRLLEVGSIKKSYAPQEVFTSEFLGAVPLK